MSKGLVTVVLPIYNVEKYLDRCIISVVNQTYKKLDILLIDDGSPDNCPKMCDEWAKKDKRIRVIHKKNEGLGMARNTGMQNAMGEYFCFLDSDDYLETDAIEKLYSLAEKEKAEITVFGLKTINANGNIVISYVPQTSYRVYSNEEVLNDFLPDYIAPDPKGDGTVQFYMSPCVLMYSTKVIRDCGFKFVSEREIISEDVYSQLELFKYIKKIAVLPEDFYCYCKNDESLSRKYQAGRYEKIKYFYNESVRLCESLGYSEKIIYRLTGPYLAFTLAALKQEFLSTQSTKEIKKQIKSIVDDTLLQTVLEKVKNDNMGILRKLLFFTMRNKMYIFTYILLKLKS